MIWAFSCRVALWEVFYEAWLGLGNKNQLHRLWQVFLNFVEEQFIHNQNEWHKKEDHM